MRVESKRNPSLLWNVPLLDVGRSRSAESGRKAVRWYCTIVYSTQQNRVPGLGESLCTSLPVPCGTSVTVRGERWEVEEVCVEAVGEGRLCQLGCRSA